MRKKMVLIGAGSSVFTKGLVLDLIKRKGEQWHLSLVDINEQALEPIYLLSKKMIEQKQADITIDRSTDRRDVLPGADFVVTTIGVGGRRAWEQDVYIPRKYGLYQSVGDATGPGGVSRTMRMIPPMIEIAKDVKRLCSGAYLLNFANPMTQICQAVAQEAHYPIAGLCHGVPNGMKRISKLMDIPYDDLSFIAGGLNHEVYVYDIRLNGVDLFPEILKKIDSMPPDECVVNPMNAQFMRDYHTYIVSNDRHFSEFHPHCFEQNGYFGKTLGIDAFSFERTIEEGDRIFEETCRYAREDGPLPESVFDRMEGEQEQLIGIIDSILYDRKKTFFINLPNEGDVAGIADRAVIERGTVVSGVGFCPMKCPNMPMPLIGFMTRYLGIYDLMNEAAITGNPKLMLDAMYAEGYIKDLKMGEKMVREMIQAQIEYLPQFQ